MQKTLFNLIALGLLLSSCGRKPPEMNCNFENDQLIEKIKTDLSADSVAIFTQSLKEEPYFPEIRCVRVVIANPITPILNFKDFQTKEYERFEDYEQIEYSLKEVGEKYAMEILKGCDISDLNDIIIEFGQIQDKPYLAHRFIIHYDELFTLKH